MLITDDEALARERLRRLLSDVGGVELIGEAANGSEALALSERLHPDLVLMDIRMPGIDGIETALHLSAAERPPAVVFTTAYGDHALAAFDANAVDYLLKPIRRERLAQALARAAVVRRSQLQAVRAEGAQPRTHICARAAGALRLIPLDEVVYFRADQKYVAAPCAWQRAHRRTPRRAGAGIRRAFPARAPQYPGGSGIRQRHAQIRRRRL